MAAREYYSQNAPSHDAHEQQQHLLSQMSSPNLSSGHPSPLKPLHLVSHNQQHTPTLEDYENLRIAAHDDAVLKSQIRRLRIISRVTAFLISTAVLIPITLTLHKFLSTQNIYRTIPSPTGGGGTITRTAWAHDTRAWPTYMYFATAAVSVVLNLFTILSYLCGGGSVERANSASYVASVFSWAVMLGNVIVWAVAAGIYRNEKDKHGKANDIWGWTCSAAARAIQREFAGEVDFNRFCNVQSVSWYIGLAQVGAALLTVGIYLLVLRRNRAKKRVKRHTLLVGGR